MDWRDVWLKMLPPLAGIGLLIGVWALLTMKSSSFPTPAATFDAAVKLFADPFYKKGPNDQGIGWNILFSLQRVAVGFGLAALVGIPLGFIIGRFTFFSGMFSPLISLLKPVSPLAWLPIGLLGTPFNADTDLTNIGWMHRLASGASADIAPAVSKRLRTPPPVPTTSIYSRSDGLVAWQTCVHAAPSHEVQDIEIDGSHVGLGWNPAVLDIVANRLGQQPSNWQPYTMAA